MALCLCHTAKNAFNFNSQQSAAEIALSTGIMSHEKEVGEDASPKEFKSHFTKIALLLFSVRLGALCLCSQTQVTFQFKTSKCLLGAGESSCRGAGIAKAGKLNRSLEKPLGTTAKNILVKRACISQCTNYVGLVTGCLQGWPSHFFHMSEKE